MHYIHRKCSIFCVYGIPIGYIVEFRKIELNNHFHYLEITLMIMGGIQ